MRGERRVWVVGAVKQLRLGDVISQQACDLMGVGRAGGVPPEAREGLTVE